MVLKKSSLSEWLRIDREYLLSVACPLFMLWTFNTFRLVVVSVADELTVLNAQLGLTYGLVLFCLCCMHF